MGVASCKRGNEGREPIWPGIWSESPGMAGLALGDGGMARPSWSLGVLGPLDRLPGMGGRRSGAGLDIFGNVRTGLVGCAC